MFENIKSLCEEKGISFHQLEKALGFSNGTIARFAKHDPRLSAVKAVADFFGVTVDDLLDD